VQQRPRRRDALGTPGTTTRPQIAEGDREYELARLAGHINEVPTARIADDSALVVCACVWPSRAPIRGKDIPALAKIEA
jgi:hypothetical protein